MGGNRIGDDVWLLVNPAAGRGRAAGYAAQAKVEFERLGGRHVLETSAAGEEEPLAASAIEGGCRTLVVVGGDGTVARVANTILTRRASCGVAMLPSGTGNDFAKTLGVRHSTPEEILHLVAKNEAAKIDVGFADGRYFLNSCGFGFDASVLEASNRVRFLRGDAVYIYSALTQLFTYRGIDVSVNGAPPVKPGNMLMVTVSNGRYLGGAFAIAPHASVLDGRLDACFFSDAGVVERVRLFAGAMRGTHLEMPAVSSVSVKQLSLTFTSKPSMEMDGELRPAGSKSVELKCISRALSVIAAPGALT